MSKRVLFLLVIIVLIAAVACQAAPAEQTASAEEAAQPDAAAPAALPEVTFVGSEYAYDGPQSIGGGWTRVTLDNQGEQPHDLMLVRILEGKTEDEVMAMLQDEEGAPPEWVDVVGSASAEAGGSGSFVSKLDPGSYYMLSFAGAGEESPPDFVLGMVRDLQVTEAAADVPESALPEADASISMVDYQFVIEGLESGEQTVRLSNDGTELHEAVMFRLKEGKTMEDFQAFMEQEVPEGEPPMEEAGMVFLSPGNVTYATLDLEAGNHVLLCFIPSEKNDMTPHFMLGMMAEVAVN